MAQTSTKSLYQLQSAMAAAIMRPLQEDSIDTNGLDADEFIKPNQKLSSCERLEIYNKQYWYRLLESLQDDFPGLNAILGHKRFEKLSIAYLTRYPSSSYTLNCLGANLAKFIQEEAYLTAPDTELAYEVASVEWAEIKAFDTQTKPIIKAELLQKVPASKITLKTQPYLTILELKYPVDNFILGLNKTYNKSVESNAITTRTVRFSKSSAIKKRRTFLAVHRLNNTIYYKRLDKDQYFLLKALMGNNTLEEACNKLISTKNNIEDQEKLALKINTSFSTWMELGWFC